MLAGFLLGLAGSFHCVGMCGPLTLLLADGNLSSKYFLGRLFYNLGRIVTYTVLGITVGFFGESLHFFVSQNVLSIAVGLLILFFLIAPKKLIYRLNFNSNISSGILPLKSIFGRLFKKTSFLAQFSFGLVNGLLPCGLVYAALSSAFLLSNFTQSGLFMLAFGLGTLPLMLPASLAFSKIKALIGSKYAYLVNFAYFSVAFWMIARGFQFDVESLYTTSSNAIIQCMPK